MNLTFIINLGGAPINTYVAIMKSRGYEASYEVVTSSTCVVAVSGFQDESDARGQIGFSKNMFKKHKAREFEIIDHQL